MGFLDKKDRVVDIVLTERGRQLFSMGALEFTYFAVFDDGLDYDPLPSTGSFSDADRQAQMETTAMLEAPYVRVRRDTVGLFEPTSHVFTAADGFDFVPRIATPVTGGFSILCDQHPGDPGAARFIRRASTRAIMEPTLAGDVESNSAGFTVRVFVSGSAGLQELHPRRDSDFRRALDAFIACTVDGEPDTDPPDPLDPRSFRR